MLQIKRLLNNIKISNLNSHKLISTSLVNCVKEIVERPMKDALVIEGITKESPRSAKLIEEASQKRFCPECTLGLDIKHTDVLILSQYVRSDGCMLPRRVTGLCHRQQKKIGSLVTMAQKAGLMPNLAPYWSKKDPKNVLVGGSIINISMKQQYAINRAGIHLNFVTISKKYI